MLRDVRDSVTCTQPSHIGTSAAADIRHVKYLSIIAQVVLHMNPDSVRKVLNNNHQVQGTSASVGTTMTAFPLSYLLDLPQPAPGVSLGDYLAEIITDSGRYRTLIDLLPSTNDRAIISPDFARPPLTHAMLRHFVETFELPTTGRAAPLKPNDRIMLALPTGPENALALLAVSSYFNCAPVNASCTAEELQDLSLIHI